MPVLLISRFTQRKVLEIANDEGMQLLHLAAAEGRVAILRFALQQDNVLPLVSSVDKHGWTPLHHGTLSQIVVMCL